MKNIYIVLTYTGTVLSKIITGYTGDEFSHVSISLDENLQHMYSFGRLNPYNPFIGGFVHEKTNKGTFKRFKNTRSKILEIPVEDNQYEFLKQNLKKFKIDRREYGFNVFGLLAVGFNKKIQGEKTFYCAEFVKYILEKSDIDMNLPELIKPDSFKNIQKSREIYEGLLKNYSNSKNRSYTKVV